MKVGRHTYGHGGIRVLWGKHGRLLIGSFCSIAAGVTVYCGGEHRTKWVTTYPFPVFFKVAGCERHSFSKGDVKIGSDVWIGGGATILSGVAIGDGAVIAACSVVSKDVEPYWIVGGNPAKKIRRRFSDAQVESLLKILWWKWTDEKIREFLPLMMSENIDKFIERATHGTA